MIRKALKKCSGDCASCDLAEDCDHVILDDGKVFSAFVCGCGSILLVLFAAYFLIVKALERF